MYKAKVGLTVNAARVGGACILFLIKMATAHPESFTVGPGVKLQVKPDVI